MTFLRKTKGIFQKNWLDFLMSSVVFNYAIKFSKNCLTTYWFSKLFTISDLTMDEVMHLEMQGVFSIFSPIWHEVGQNHLNFHLIA